MKTENTIENHQPKSLASKTNITTNWQIKPFTSQIS